MAGRTSRADEAKAEKAHAELRARLENIAAKIEGVTPKTMFGYRYFFHQGNDVAGLMGSAAQFYLDATASAEFLSMPGTNRWMTKSREPGEGWHGLNDAVTHDDALMEEWMRRAAAFAATLPPKVKKQKAPKQKAPKQKAPKQKAAEQKPLKRK
jgi:hypothetical protein